MPYDLGVIKRQRREPPVISTSTYGGNFVGFYSSGTNYYAVHIFTSSGQFTKPSYVTTTTAQVLVVAGGGGGGGPATGSGVGAGGGGGGVVNSSTYSITATLTILIGAGGATNVTGSASTVTGSITTLSASGGGRGGAPLNGSGATGGSGGGGSGTGTGGSATATQGNAGGAGGSQTSYAGGGGGASAVGGAANASAAGQGGSGTITLITGSPIWVAGGGGGAANATGYNNSSYGGGGAGGTTSVVAGTAGTANSGGGGGGGGGTTGAGGAGGSGIVIITYSIPANLYPQVQSDPYFANNALLLNAGSISTSVINTNNFVGNVISDTSINAWSISNTGGTASTLNPFDPSSNHSLYFNGSAYIISAANAMPQLATNFTVEFWMYAVSSDNLTNHWLIGTLASNGFNVFHRNNYINISQLGTISYTSPTAFLLNQWIHVAVVRASNIFYIYQNGNSVLTQSWNPTFVSGSVSIGGSATQGAYHTGYLSNIRVVSYPVYTGNFIVPVEQLSTVQNAFSTNISAINTGTTLLTGRFSTTSTSIVDYSTLTNALTFSGVTVSSLNPFAGITTYDSIYFGSDPHLISTGLGGANGLSIATNTAFGYGAGDYTIETWFYWTGSQATDQAFLFDQRDVDPEPAPMVIINGGWKVRLNGSYVINGGDAIPNVWTHIALVKRSNVLKLFINGSQVGSSYSDTLTYTASTRMVIGTWWQGYLSNFRVVKGLAVYTDNFTVPTGPLQITQVANAYGGSNTAAITTASSVSLLTAKYYSYYQSGSGFVDNGTNNLTITPRGDPGQGTFSPFGNNWSTLFNGTTDYLNIPVIYSSSATLTALNFGSNNFTIETWAYLTANTGTAYIAGQYNTSNFAPAGLYLIANKPTLGVSTLGTQWNINTTATTALSTGTWNHIAAVRNSTRFSVYINGIEQSFTVTSISLYSTATNMLIGRAGSAVTSMFPGYLSNLRIINGTAVYTSAFTPLAAPLPIVSNTSLLVAAGGYHVDKSSYNFVVNTGTVTSAPAITKFTPYKLPGEYNKSMVGGSVYFNTTTAASQNLSLGSQSSLALGSGNYTVELWVYANSYNASNSVLVDWRTNAGTTAAVPVLYLLANGTVQWQNTGGTGFLTSPNPNPIPLNTWNHIAMVRYNSMLYMYINGVVVATVADSTALTIQTFFINSPITASNQTLFGYISNVRILAGTAIYTPTLTVPTTSLTSVTNTVLLTLQNDGPRLKDNSLNNFALTKPNTSTIFHQVLSPFGGSGSAYFNGRSYLTVSTGTSLAFAFGTDEFTLEAWVYPTARNGTYGSVIVGPVNYPSITDWLWMINTGGYLYIQFNNGSFLTSNSIVNLNVWSHVACVRLFGILTLYINGQSSGNNINDSSLLSSAASSIYFNGSDAQLSIPNNGSNVIGTSEFTIETWVYIDPTAINTNTIMERRTYNAVGTGSWHFYIGDGGNLVLYQYQTIGYIIQSGDGVILKGQWYHVAVSRDSLNVIRLFVNGVLKTSVTNAYNFSNTNPIYIGYNSDAAGVRLKGYLSNLRFIIGTAVYINNFSPILPLTNSYPSITQLLLLGLPTVDSSGNSAAITNVNVTYNESIVPTVLSVGGGITTVTNTINVGIGGAINGNIATTFNGYIANLHVIKGVAKYTSAFTPPTSDVTATSNSSLLTILSTDITFIDNSSNSFAITNSTTATTLQPFSPYSTGSWSTYFDGSSYEYIVNSDPLILSTSTTWTIETWVNPTGNYTSSNILFTKRNTGQVNRSLSFNGTNQFLSITSSTVFQFGTSDFTIEAWFYWNGTYAAANNGNQYTIISNIRTGEDTSWDLQYYSGYWRFAGWYTIFIVSSISTFEANTWNHIAVTSRNRIGKIWFNGLNVGTSDMSSSNFTSINPVRIGWNGYNQYWNGYINNLRVVKGVALYTGNFYPPSGLVPTTQTVNYFGGINTQAIIDSTSTSLIVGQFAQAGLSGNISDFSYYNNSIANNNTVVPSILGPRFYASVSFNGTDQFLISTKTDGFLTSDDHTVEAWIYINSYSDTLSIIAGQSNGTNVSTFEWYVSSGNYGVGYRSGSLTTIASSTPLSIRTWHHVAFSRSGTTVKLFADGAQVASGTVSSYTSQDNLTIGYLHSSSPYYFNGYISNVRILNGVALYTDSFTPPTGSLSKSIPIGSSGYASNSMIFSPSYVYVTNSNFAFGANDFTIECWVWMDGTNSSIYAGFVTTVSVTISGFSISRDFFGLVPPNGSGPNDAIAWTVPSNSWCHVAMTLKSGVVQGWLNGVGTATLPRSNITSNPAEQGTTLFIGNRYANTSVGTYPFVGYISNVRFTYGLAVYTGNFSVPTTELQTTQSSGTNIQSISDPTYVKLLTGKTNLIADYSIYANDVTATASTNTTFFGEVLTTYPTYGLSFSGNPRYLQVGTVPSNWTFLHSGQQDWTMECWFYTNTTSYESLLSTSAYSAAVGFELSLNYPSFGSIYLGFTNGTNMDNIGIRTTDTGLFSQNIWIHVAVTFVSSSKTVAIFLNGVSQNLTTSSSPSSYGFSGSSPTNNLAIGYGNWPSTYFSGYMSNIRITKSIVYTGNFTVPSALLETRQIGVGNIASINTASYVSLLTGQSNVIIDNSVNNYTIINDRVTVVTTPTYQTGDATIYTSNYTSLLTANFSGTATYVVDYSDNNNTVFQNNLPLPSLVSPFASVDYSSNTSTSYQGYLNTNTGYIGFYNGTTYSTSTTALTTGTWNHIAYTYENITGANTINLYVNGNRVMQTTTTIISDYNEPLYIGGSGSTTDNFYGYMSNFRIVKNSALYLGSYVGIPSTILSNNNDTDNTLPFPLTSTIRTSLLTLNNNRLLDSSINTNTIYASGAPKAITMSPFAANPNLSVYFNGTTDFINVSAQTSLNLGTGDFTIDVWVYPTAAPVANGYSPVLDARTDTGIVPWFIGMYSNGGFLKAIFFDSGTLRQGSTTIQLGAWTHLAWTRTNSILKIFVNGAVDFTLSNFITPLYAQGPIQLIGKMREGINYMFQGHMSNLRVVKGRSLYTGNFNPSQLPLNLISGAATNLLAKFTDARAIDYSGNTVIKANTSTVSLSNTVTKNNIYSMNFNGFSDTLLISTSTVFNYANNDFTWEMWIYPTNPIWSSTSTYIIEQGRDGASVRYINNKLFYYNPTTLTSTASSVLSISSSTWTHLAVARSSGVVSLFVNGAFVVSATDTYNFTNQSVSIGNTSTYFQGYIEDLRITKGLARYTASFVPPTKLSNR